MGASTVAFETPLRVWHPSWEGTKAGNVGHLLARYDSEGRYYGWVIPPGSLRPLTFRMDSLTFVDGIGAQTYAHRGADVAHG